MTCRDFEDAWHARLDGLGPPSPALVAAIEAHAARCPGCRERGRRFETLLQAIESLGPPPAAPAGAAERIAARHRAEGAPKARAHSFAPNSFRLAAAAVLLAVGVGLRYRSSGQAGARPPRPPVAGKRALPLGTTVAVAASATVDLARETSGPAARVGLRALDATPFPAASPAAEVPGDTASQVVQAVGAGVRPLTGSARHAFAFLIRPAPRPRAQPAAPRTLPRSE